MGAEGFGLKTRFAREPSLCTIVASTEAAQRSEPPGRQSQDSGRAYGSSSAACAGPATLVRANANPAAAISQPRMVRALRRARKLLAIDTPPAKAGPSWRPQASGNRRGAPAIRTKPVAIRKQRPVNGPPNRRAFHVQTR